MNMKEPAFQIRFIEVGSLYYLFGRGGIVND